jgi:hypothetical protein
MSVEGLAVMRRSFANTLKEVLATTAEVGSTRKKNARSPLQVGYTLRGEMVIHCLRIKRYQTLLRYSTGNDSANKEANL